MKEKRSKWICCFIVLALLLSVPSFAVKEKGGKATLDSVVTIAPELRVVETNEDYRAITEVFATQDGIAKFLSENSKDWYVTVDMRRGVPTLIDGGAIPFIPGPMNNLSWSSFGAGCESIHCIPQEKIDLLVREFLAKYPGLFPVKQEELIMEPDSTTPIGESFYLINLKWYVDGIPVENGSVFFRINNGNLIAVSSSYIAPMKLDTNPILTADTAWEILNGYLGEDKITEKDQILERGKLIIIPTTPRGMNANTYMGPAGTMYSYNLAYRLMFRRPGVMGTWEAMIDAHTGEILRFVDANKYGKIQGGTYKTDANPTQTEVVMPFPYADYGTGTFADIGGNYTGTTGTSTMSGRSGSAGNVGAVDVVDTCGAISLASDGTGLINFGSSTGTDCTTPGVGGAGNTHASRTQYYNVAWIKIKAYTYLSGNAAAASWLQGVLTDNVNVNSTCNANWDGTAINFFRSGGGCGNTGELPGVSLHEWAHGMDDNDGAGDARPVETRADWTAIMQTHQSCAGGGFFVTYDSSCGNPPVPGIGFNCGGYGDCCINCSGIRDADWAKHTSNTPWNAANYGTLYDCSGGSYYGPCGGSSHCESGIASQALWDLVNRDLPTYCSMDVTSAWQLIDRLWYSSMPQMLDMYTCTVPTSNGCGGTSLFNLFRSFDDTGDGTANGTPHAQGIFQAFNRHMIACGAAGDATNQNQTTCPTLTITTLSGVAGSNSAVLSWSAVTGATRYFVYRNDTACDSGFTKIATVASPGYTDTAGTNGITSYYRIQAATALDACVSAMSNCVGVTPQPCAGTIMLDKALYSCTGTGTITVLDSTAPASPFTVQAWSTTYPTVRTVTVTGSPSTYTGSFTTTTGAPGANQIQVAAGDTLYFRYTDPDYCGTLNQAVNTTATIDCTGPVISNVQIVSVTGTTARITWTTNEAANSRVTYGISTPPGTNQDDLTTYVTSHTMNLTGLITCTQYYFSVTSADVAANSTTDTNGGAYYTFTTPNTNQTVWSENFSTVTVPALPAGWTISSTSGNNWVTNASGCTNNALMYPYNGTAAANSYAYTPGIALTTGITYTVAFNQKVYSATYPEIFEVRCGSAATPAGQTIVVLASASYTNTACQPLSGTFTVPSNGTYYLSFHCTSTANMWNLYVDDIVLSRPGTCGPDLAYVSNTYTDVCGAGGAGNGDTYIDPGETITVHPTIINNGGSATGISATLSTVTPNITVTGATATYPNLAAMASAACNAPHFTYTVGSGVACGTVINFTLTITASSGGPWTGNFSHTVGHIVAGTPTTVFTESYDGATFPPTGWTSTQVSGTTGAWARVTTSSNPTGITPHSGTAMAEFNSYHATSGNSTRLARTANISIPAGAAAASAVLWVYHETSYSGYTDQIQVQTSPDGTTWTTRGTAVNRYDGSTGWKQHTIDLAALIGAGNFRIGYLGVSNYGSDTYMDDVSVAYTPGTCTVIACSGCTVPAAPTAVTATAGCTGNSVAWTNAPTATSHNVLRGTTCGTVLNTFTNVTTPYNDTSAVAGTAYQYWVVGLNACGTSANSTCSAATRTAVPAAPTAVTATAGCTGNSVAWTNAPTATSHNVLRGTTCGTVLNTFTNVTTPYNDTSAVAGTAYQYWVVGLNACGTSANSTCSAATRTAVPAAPTAVTATASCTGNSVAWTNAPTATSHNVLRGTTCGTVLNTFTNVTTPYNDTSAVAGTAYQYWVVGLNACGTSANSTCSAATRTAVPAAPTAVTATAGCTGNSVAWTNAPTATSHNVLRGTTCGTVLNTFTNVTTPYNDTSAVAGTAYQYWVVGLNACGTSANSTCSAATRLAVPAAPTAVTATAGCTGNSVAWTNAPTATSHNVLRGTTCGTVLNTFTNVTTPYNDTSAVAGTAYQYWVVGLNACGTSANSTCSAATRLAIPAAPTAVTATAGCTGNSVAWTNAPTATSHNVLRGTTCGTVLNTFTNVTTPYNDTSAVAGTAYQYWVVGLNACGTSANSTCSAATRTAVPAAPTAVTATAGCTGNSVAWTNAPTATSHNVLRGTTCGTVLNTFTNVTTPYNDTSAVAGTAYQYWVVGLNACGTSANSTCSAATRLAVPAAPSAPTVNDVAACAMSGVQITWGAVSGATSYDLRYNGATIVVGVTSPYTYAPGDTSAHNYEIRALNACGTGSWSAPTSGTDANGTPTAPVIATVVDNNPSIYDGVIITFSTGAPATQHDLYIGAVQVATAITSPHLYVPAPADGLPRSYVVRAVNGTCYTDSTPVVGTDAAAVVVVPPEIGIGTAYPADAQNWPTATQVSQIQAWPSTPTATGYKLWRGLLANLPNLVNGSTDFCHTDEFAALTQDCTADDASIVAGRCYYYLVTAYNGAGDGPSGDALILGVPTARTLNTTCP